MNQSSIKLLSNIMLKSRVTKSKDGSISYLPFDLMPTEYGDVRNDQFLTEYQRTQKLKAMFAAKRIVDVGSDADIAEEVNASQDHATCFGSIKDDLENNPKDDAGYNELSENDIPEVLYEDSIDLLVKGAYSGWFYLVPYDGSVKDYTDKQTETMHLLVMRKGRQKKVPVSVVNEDRVIYIREELFTLYEKEFGNSTGVEIIRPHNK